MCAGVEEFWSRKPRDGDCEDEEGDQKGGDVTDVEPIRQFLRRAHVDVSRKDDDVH